MYKIDMYFVTVFEKLPSADYPDTGDKLCVGFFASYKEAHGVVANNIGDIHEQTYTYAVIERIEEGVYSQFDRRWFYKFANKGYEPIQTPEETKNWGNYSIS